MITSIAALACVSLALTAVQTHPGTDSIQPIPAAPTEIEVERPVVRLGTMVQLRNEYTSTTFSDALNQRLLSEFAGVADLAALQRTHDDSTRRGDGLRLRRAFVKAEAEPFNQVSMKVLLDFASLAESDEPHHVVKAFFGDLAMGKRVFLRLGLFKIPFGVSDSVSAARLEVAEKGTTHEFLKALGLGGRDVGVMATFEPLPNKHWLQVELGAFQGNSNGGQSPVPGLFAARFQSRLWKSLRLGGGVSWRPRPVTEWWEYHRYHFDGFVSGRAIGADGRFRRGGFEVRTEIVAGDRTDVDLPDFGRIRRGDARTFLAAWGIASWALPIATGILRPAVRIEWLDTDREHDTGRIFTTGGALSYILSPSFQVLLDISHNAVEPGTRDWEVLVVRYWPSFVRAIVQAQMLL